MEVREDNPNSTKKLTFVLRGTRGGTGRGISKTFASAAPLIFASSTPAARAVSDFATPHDKGDTPPQKNAKSEASQLRFRA